MTDKEIIIDGIKLEDIKNLLYTGQKMSISTKTFEAMVDKIEDLHAENDDLSETFTLRLKDLLGKYERALERRSNKIKFYEQALEELQQIAIMHYTRGTLISGNWLSKVINEVLKDDKIKENIKSLFERFN